MTSFTPLPFTFVNGTEADATQVDANFAYFAGAFGSTVVGYNRNVTGSGLRALQDKLGESISIEDFSPSESGDPTENAIALTNAMNFCVLLGGGSVYFPSGAYPMGDVSVPGSVTLRGDGPSASLLLPESTTENFITLSGTNCGFIGLGIVSNVAGASGAMIYIDGPGARLSNFSIYANSTPTSHLWNGIEFDSVNGTDYYIDSFFVGGALNANIASGDAANTTSVTLPLGMVANGVMGSYSTGVNILIYLNGGTTWSNIQMLKGQHGVYTHPSAGQKVFAQKFIQVFSDTMSGDAFLFGTNGGTLANTEVVSCWGCSSTGGVGCRVQGFAAGQINGFDVVGGDWMVNYAEGLRFVNVKNFSVTSAKVFNNSLQGSGSSPGISIGVGTTGFTITGNMCGIGGVGELNDYPAYQSYGIVVNDTASSGYIITLNRGAGNLSDILFDNGTGTKYVANNLAV